MNEALQPFTKNRAYLDFRIRTAVWGTLLAVALLISSAASWVEARDQPGPFGEGPRIGRSVWALARIPAYDESDPRRWWARLALVCLVVAALVAAAAAATGSAGVARATGVVGGCTAVSTAIVWLVSNDTYFRATGGLYVALTVAVALTVWGFVVARAADEHDVWPNARPGDAGVSRAKTTRESSG